MLAAEKISLSSGTEAESPAWTRDNLANPHLVADKARRVKQMFTAIAPSYDLNNRLHSMGMDQYWRGVAVKMAGLEAGDRVADIACGTGDLTLKFARAVGRGGELAAGQVMGIDFTFAMLPLARKKAAAGFSKAAFLNGDALRLALPDASVDVVSIAFGIRNVADWGAAIAEFHRVLKPGGRLIVLEFSLPKNAVLRGFYNFYFRRIMPVTATLISHDRSGAYKYLPESVNTFITPEAMQERMAAAGFGQVMARSLTCGICFCYRGVKG